MIYWNYSKWETPAVPTWAGIVLKLATIKRFLGGEIYHILPQLRTLHGRNTNPAKRYVLIYYCQSVSCRDTWKICDIVNWVVLAGAVAEICPVRSESSAAWIRLHESREERERPFGDPRDPTLKGGGRVTRQAITRGSRTPYLPTGSALRSVRVKSVASIDRLDKGNWPPVSRDSQETIRH